MKLSVSTRKRFALFIDELATGGAQRVMILLSKQLVQRGHNVDVVVLSDRGELFHTLDPGVNLVNLASMSDSRSSIQVGILSLFRLVRYLRRWEPDGVLSTLTGANLLSVVAWHLAGRKGRLVIREATSLRNVSSKRRLVLMSLLYKRASCVVALTKVHAAELGRRLSISPSRLSVVGNPLDTSVFVEPDNEALERRISSFGKYLLAVGRLIPAKNYSSLIRAFDMMRASGDCPNLVIVGDGPERQKLQSLIDKLSLGEHVTLAGNQSNLAQWYRHAQGFVLTSLWEGYPNALLEALYYELPVSVTLYDDSIREIIESLGVESVSFSEPNNPQDISRSLRSLAGMKPNKTVGVELEPIVVAYEQLLLG